MAGSSQKENHRYPKHTSRYVLRMPWKGDPSLICVPLGKRNTTAKGLRSICNVDSVGGKGIDSQLQRGFSQNRHEGFLVMHQQRFMGRFPFGCS
jgi:hypothetical protein